MNRPRTLLLMMLLSLTTLVGCSSKSGFVAQYPPPEQLGRIGAAVNQNPGRMEAILKQHDLTVEQFENAVEQVSSDPSLARRYREGFSAESEEDSRNDS